MYKKILKAISTSLLVCLCLQATPAQCAEKAIFFKYSTAQRLLVDVTYYKQAATDRAGRLLLCDEDRTLLELQATNLNQKVDGLTLDKEIYRIEADKFQALYVVADTKRVKADNDAPSRFRWFTAGVVTALVAGIAAALALK